MKKNHFLRVAVLAALLIFSLVFAGCSGDDGDDGINGIDGVDGVDGIDGSDGADFEMPRSGEFVGAGNCAACHGGSTVASAYAESAHANQGSHTISSCSQSCHNPLGDGEEVAAAFGTGTPNAVGCESCHGKGGDHFGVGPIEVADPGIDTCGQCHDGTIADGTAHITHHPFNAEITTRFQTSRHANQHAREAFCSACHSHEGGVALLEMGGAENVLDLADKYTSATVPTWSLTEEELSTKQCDTCHNPHSLELRGKGETVVTAEWDGEEEEAVVYSAEFNLCTTCHMVGLDYEPAGHGDAGILFEYTLSDESYTAANMYDEAAGTYDYVEFEIENADGTTRTREVYATQVHYHDNASPELDDAGNYHDHNIGRKFADTHFNGTAMGAIAGLDADAAVGPEDTTITGYNVNAAAEDACTVCHDPHTAGKIVSTADGEHDDPTNTAVAYAEGVGEFHKDFLGDAMGHGCQPCHAGGEGFVAWTFGGSMPTARETEPIGCRTCHALALPNLVVDDGEGGHDVINNAEAFDDVREFDAGHSFAFPGYVTVDEDEDGVADVDADGDIIYELESDGGPIVDVAALGVNQICFECHKGRTPALNSDQEALVVNEYEDDLDDDGDDETYVGTENRTYAYLHYAPAFATLYGDESGVVPTYEGKTYAGRFTHGGGQVNGITEFGCADCHNVHDTANNNVVENKMIAGGDCGTCHLEGGFADWTVLKERTEAFSMALLETLLPVYLAADDTANLYPPLQAFIDDLQAAADDTTRLTMLAEYLEGRTNVGPNPAAAKAATVWKIFTYEDGSPHGPLGVHGHGGSWAHNSRFARQVMFDAIESLDANAPAAYGLTRAQ